jgi:predicted O-linked N-acetylglucosamine transferase (SPINDLY family)
LWLKHRCFASPDTQAVFRQRFAQWGIHPDRLKFAGASGYLDYLAFYNQLSLALDPFPYHGGLTSAEALWMGVPLLNLQGPMQGGLSLLSQVGHPEWSAASAADFETQAAELLQTPWGLEERKNLRRACEAAPFAQADLLLRELEQQVLTLAQKHLLPSA